MVFHSPSDFDLARDAPRAMPRPRRVLLTHPAHFAIKYVINPHMAGHIGTVDGGAALHEWTRLREAYRALGFEVHVLEGVAGLPDMVFCANQTLPYLHPETGEKGVVLSRMHAPQRQGEPAHFEAFFERQGYRVRHLPDDVADFEGMGDAIWHPERALLWGGYGHRTDPAAYDFLTEELGVPVVALELVDPDFYHLDTCLCVLDAQTAMYYPGAFTAEGRALLERGFARLIEVPEEEARVRFACNAHCPDARHVLLPHGSPTAIERLCAARLMPIELRTDEFLKAGGSVFCMKLMYW